MSATLLEADVVTAERAPKPLTEGRQSAGILIALWAFVVLPFLAVLVAVPVAWGWGLTWLDVVLGLAMYLIGGFGSGVGFHRYLTHSSFKAKRAPRIVLTHAR